MRGQIISHRHFQLPRETLHTPDAQHRTSSQLEPPKCFYNSIIAISAWPHLLPVSSARGDWHARVHHRGILRFGVKQRQRATNAFATLLTTALNP